jgi:hypothetical protein
MFRWLRERRQRAHLANVARVLEQENERLRGENARARRDVARCNEIAEVLAHAAAKVEAIKKREAMDGTGIG